MWTFIESQKYLDDTAPQGKSVYGLERINHLLDLLHHPESNIKLITVVGTNGKGSVVAFMDGLLRAHGINTACHIKPHLEQVTERIRLNGIDSTPNEFCEALWEVKSAIDSGWDRNDRPTYFELIFASFLVAAKHAEVEVAILEAGLGGRFDAVNAVDADLVVLTSVDYDHMDLLGNTLKAITTEKIQVVRKGSNLVCQQNTDEVMNTVREYCTENHVKLVCMSDHPLIAEKGEDEFCYISSIGEISSIKLGLHGQYQILNASLALLAFEVSASDVYPGLFPDRISAEAIRNGLLSARLPGRWEKIKGEAVSGEWILDGAHNPGGLSQVFDMYRKLTDGKGVIIFGMKKDKHAEMVAAMITNSAAKVVFVKVPSVESYNQAELAYMVRTSENNLIKSSQFEIHCADSINDALQYAIKANDKDLPILVTGSLYLVGAVRSILMSKKPILK